MNMRTTPRNKMTGFAMRGGIETGVKLTTQEELVIAQEVRYSMVLNSIPGAQKRLDDMNEQLRLLETITDEAHNDYILFGFDL